MLKLYISLRCRTFSRFSLQWYWLKHNKKHLVRVRIRSHFGFQIHVWSATNKAGKVLTYGQKYPAVSAFVGVKPLDISDQMSGPFSLCYWAEKLIW